MECRDRSLCVEDQHKWNVVTEAFVWRIDSSGMSWQKCLCGRSTVVECRGRSLCVKDQH